ncbi:hypothetical protein [Streptomyces mirabilis]|uniref:Uncharacterized protein n=1 Tax=Streptomyces mirabilis TaxID=68239 RepID=A0ABU3V8N1_9ACTN|nr:hypothetical protein [Streptomyces mirabilis]MCX4617528.1 hypothetical protein [Streptomyces mirabilis]MDU9002114.1 hypothetical protein [Streptomyces mirabilis]
MTTADHGSGATSAREPDREKIDRIAAYVDDQRKAEKSWFQQWSTFTVYLALAAFFFGIGTWSDLRNRIAGPPPDPAQLTKDSFVKMLETFCKPYVGQAPNKNKGTGFARVAADDLHVLNVRQQMGLVWTTYSAPTGMDSKATPVPCQPSSGVKTHLHAFSAPSGGVRSHLPLTSTVTDHFAEKTSLAGPFFPGLGGRAG